MIVVVQLASVLTEDATLVSSRANSSPDLLILEDIKGLLDALSFLVDFLELNGSQRRWLLDDLLCLGCALRGQVKLALAHLLKLEVKLQKLRVRDACS